MGDGLLWPGVEGDLPPPAGEGGDLPSGEGEEGVSEGGEGVAGGDGDGADGVAGVEDGAGEHGAPHLAQQRRRHGRSEERRVGKECSW